MNHLKSMGFLYLLLVVLAGSAFQVYSSSLSHYMWAIPMCMINVVSLITLIGYGRIESFLKQSENEKRYADSVSLIKAFRSAPIPIVVMGLLSFLQFAIMLPWITSQEAAIYFLLAASVARVAVIPLSILIFGDSLGSKKIYWLGLFLSLLGVIIFKYESFINIENNVAFLISSVLFMGFVLLNSILSRYFTSKPVKNREINHLLAMKYQYIPVVTKVRWTMIIESILFGLIALVIVFVPNSFVFKSDYMLVLPHTVTEILSILWIGIVVVIAGTLAVRIKNDIGETVTGALEGYRPLIALLFLVPIINIVFDSTEVIHYYEIIGAVISMLGAFVSGKAKPKIGTSNKLKNIDSQLIDRTTCKWVKLEASDILSFDEETQSKFLGIAKNAFGNYKWSEKSYERTFIQKNNYIYALRDDRGEDHGFIIVEIPSVRLEEKQFVFVRKIALDDSVKGKKLGLRYFIEQFRLDVPSVKIEHIGLKTQNPKMMRSLKNLCDQTYPFDSGYTSEKGDKIMRFLQTNTMELTDNLNFEKESGILRSCYDQTLGVYETGIAGMEAEEIYLEKHQFDRANGDAVFVVGRLDV